MRSIPEITFRARQEAANLLLLALQPAFSGEAPLSLALPDGRATANALSRGEYALQVERIAEEVLAHRLSLLGVTIDTGPEIRWRRDYEHGKESGTNYFRRIRYLDFSSVGDHKFVWELNRHQHLVLLAEAFLLTGREEFKQEIFSELDSWFEQNPFQRGINWASALEVGLRTLSWIWIFHFAGSEMPEAFRRRFLTGLYRHGLHLAENLSVYFSPNTHLLGEAVALHALGALFPAFPGSAKWKRRGAEIVIEQLDFQVQPDGSHFEQSTYYHVYALDFFLFFYLVGGRPPELEPRLQKMAEYLHWLLGTARRIDYFGDDDGGRVFHPYGARNQFGRATLATCGLVLGRDEWIGGRHEIAEQAAWWLGPQSLEKAGNEEPPTGSRLFENSGMAFLQAGDLFVQIDCGPFGWAGAGHSHSDTLSITVSLNGERVLLDPGTYTYMSDPEERNWFRGSAAHNSVRIDGLNQARVAGPFRWTAKPRVQLEEWQPRATGGVVQARCEYEGFTHRRRVELQPEKLVVADEIEGPAGDHVCEQIWQLGEAASKAKFSFSVPAAEQRSQYSPAYGTRCSGRARIATVRGPLPTRMTMTLEPIE